MKLEQCRENRPVQRMVNDFPIKCPFNCSAPVTRGVHESFFRLYSHSISRTWKNTGDVVNTDLLSAQIAPVNQEFSYFSDFLECQITKQGLEQHKNDCPFKDIPLLKIWMDSNAMSWEELVGWSDSDLQEVKTEAGLSPSFILTRESLEQLIASGVTVDDPTKALAQFKELIRHLVDGEIRDKEGPVPGIRFNIKWLTTATISRVFTVGTFLENGVLASYLYSPDPNPIQIQYPFAFGSGGSLKLRPLATTPREHQERLFNWLRTFVESNCYGWTNSWNDLYSHK